MALGKIQMIKMLREANPSLGLKEAKAIVDSYEIKDFENRVVAYLGEDAREELHRYAWNYTSLEKAKREQASWEASIAPTPEWPVYPSYSETENGNNCTVENPCDECREDLGLKNSQTWSDITGIKVLDPDGWDRKNYQVSWGELITRDEFIHRAGSSTCRAWPTPLYDEVNYEYEDDREQADRDDQYERDNNDYGYEYEFQENCRCNDCLDDLRSSDSYCCEDCDGF